MPDVEGGCRPFVAPGHHDVSPRSRCARTFVNHRVACRVLLMRGPCRRALCEGEQGTDDG